MNQLLPDVIEITRAAGAVIMGFYDDADSFQVAQKGEHPNNPVTDADFASDRLLRERLSALLPEAGWLSEETADTPERLEKSRVWVVDPLDGTREFVMGIPEFTVSVALVEDGMPRLGVIFNPVTDEVYAAARGAGATYNGDPVRVTERTSLRGAAVDASRSERRRGEFEPFEALLNVRTMGSIAYKLARVAGGQCDATWSRGPKNEWDICAGVLLVEEAGGRCVDLENRRLPFNQPRPKVGSIVADNGRLHDEIMSLLAQYGAARVGDQRA
jgi:myo-inositol-1(or 4)-monophosphatase